MKKYRFFFHYNKFNKKMTVHYRGKCYIAKNIICEPETQTKWNKIQPHIVLQGWCSNIIHTPDSATDLIVIRN